jgi:MFS family permease
MSDILTWYLLFGSAGTSLGMMVSGWTMTLLQETKGWEFVAACRVIFLIYAAVGAVKFLLTAGLSKSVEAAKKQKKKQVSQPDPASNGQVSETEPLLGSNQEQQPETEPEPQPQPEPEQTVGSKRSIPFLPGVEPQFVGLVTSVILLFALDSFASGLASLYVPSNLHLQTITNKPERG